VCAYYAGESFFETKIKADSNDISECQHDDSPSQCTAEKLYSCTQCEKQCISQNGLKVHTRVHHKGNLGKYKCPECDRYFQNPLMLTMHRQTHGVKINADSNDVTEHPHHDNPGPHTEEELYSCAQCEYKCTECGKGFRNPLMLTVHRRRQCMAKKLYSCTQCEKKFTSQIRLKSHISVCHRAKYKCTECLRDFRNPLMLTVHRRSQCMAEKLYSCTLCEKKFTSQIRLQLHTNVHHRGKYKCTECGRSFRNPLMLTMHRQRHSVKIVADSSDVTEHPHDDSPGPHTEEKLYSCTQCEEKFASQNRLRSHAIIYHRGKYRCTECGKGFRNPAALALHRRSHGMKIVADSNDVTEHPHDDNPGPHTEEKLYTCTQCKKQFINQKVLDLHTGKFHKRKYRCPECRKSFRCKQVLNLHICTHSGKKNSNDKLRHYMAEKMYPW